MCIYYNIYIYIYVIIINFYYKIPKKSLPATPRHQKEFLSGSSSFLVQSHFPIGAMIESMIYFCVFLHEMTHHKYEFFQERNCEKAISEGGEGACLSQSVCVHYYICNLDTKFSNLTFNFHNTINGIIIYFCTQFNSSI